MERISRPRKIITRSPPDAINIIPTVPNSSSVWNSPAGRPSHSTQIIETSTVSAATTRKTSVKESRIGSSTTMPLKALLGTLGPADQSQTQAQAAAPIPASESPPVAQRCVRLREKASTSITSTPVTERISSGSRSSILTSGEMPVVAKLRFIICRVSPVGRAARRLIVGGREQRVHAVAHHLFVERDVLRHAAVRGSLESPPAVEEDEDGQPRRRLVAQESLRLRVAEHGHGQPALLRVVAQEVVGGALRVFDA